MEKLLFYAVMGIAFVIVGVGVIAFGGLLLEMLIAICRAFA